MCPYLEVCHFCLVILQVKQLQVGFQVSTWSMYIFTVNATKHEKKTQGECENLG